MAAKHHRVPARVTQLIDHFGQPALRVALLRGPVEGELHPEDPLVHIRQLQGHQPQADATLPGLAHQDSQPAIHVGLQVGGLGQALAALVLIHVVVAHLDRQRADALAVGADLGHQLVRHPTQRRLEKSLVGLVLGKGLLLPVGLGGGTNRDDRPVVPSLGELPQGRRHRSEQQLQQLARRGRDLSNARQPGGVQPARGGGAHPGKPSIGQGMKKPGFVPAGHLVERRGLVQLGGDLAHQLVRADPLADGDLQRLADRVAKGAGDEHRILSRGGEIQIALVDRRDLDIGREIIGVAEHPLGEALVLLVVAWQDDELGAELPRPAGGHRGVDAELARLVRGGGDDPALLAAHRDRLPPQPGIGGLLHRGEEGVGIQMDEEPRRAIRWRIRPGGGERFVL